MKTMKKIFCLLLCFAMLSSLTVGCKKQSEQAQQAQEQVEVVPTTETYLVKNGVSPYKILIPENASDLLEVAASELQFFFKEATGITLEITTKVDNVQGKYLSIGDTAIKAAAGVDTSYEVVERDGYRVLTYGDAIIMAGRIDKGTIYAVYGFLGKQFGLEIYHPKVWEIRKTTDAKLVDLDWTDKPDIPYRTGVNSTNWYQSDLYDYRMRINCLNENWGLAGHSYFVVLPPAEYIQEHPEWYDDVDHPLALCFSQDAMTEQFIENLKQIILDSPDCNYYMLGHEDGTPQCNCSDCSALTAQYGGKYAANEILWTNKVVRAINEWAAETIPDRRLDFMMFAYTSTAYPPVYYDEATQSYYPLYNDEDLYLEDNLGVQIALIGTPINYSYAEGPDAALLEGWSALTDNLYMWGYSCPFGDYLSPFDGFGAYKANYMDYVERGIQFVFEQGFIGGWVPNWHDLRGYLISELMWDCTQDTDTLVCNFMRNYYGPGWESIYEFYTLWRLRLTELMDYGMYSHVAYQLQADYKQPNYYPKTLLDQYEALFDAALAKTEELKETDPELYDMYVLNIKAERLMIRNLQLSIYPQYYDYETYQAMITEFTDLFSAKNGTYTADGNQSLNDYMQPWIENLNSM